MIGFSFAENSFMQISKGIHLFFFQLPVFLESSVPYMVLDSWHEIYFFCLEPCGFHFLNEISLSTESLSLLCSTNSRSQETHPLGKWWCRHTWKLPPFFVSFSCHGRYCWLYPLRILAWINWLLSFWNHALGLWPSASLFSPLFVFQKLISSVNHVESCCILNFTNNLVFWGICFMYILV